MNLRSDYPSIMQGLDEVEELRYLLVIDKNYDDVDSDEFDVFDPSEYNFMVYATERLQDRLGKERLLSVIEKLSTDKAFTNFYAHEDDIYGVMTTLDEEMIAKTFLDMMEESLS